MTWGEQMAKRRKKIEVVLTVEEIEQVLTAHVLKTHPGCDVADFGFDMEYGDNDSSNDSVYPTVDGAYLIVVQKPEA